MRLKLSILYTEQSNGSYFAVCPDLKSCFTQGDTLEQAMCQIKDLINTTIKEELMNDDLITMSQVKSKIFSEYELVV
jgi:predicted RNase H-like HicB family nuclease